MANKQKIKEYAFVYLVVILVFYASLFLVNLTKTGITGAAVSEAEIVEVQTVQQDEASQKSFSDTLIYWANKIGIPLKSEEAHNPSIFFQSYGFTLILSIISLILVLYIVKNAVYLKKPVQILLSKPAMGIKALTTNINKASLRLREKRKQRLLEINRKKEEKQKEHEMKLKQKVAIEKHKVIEKSTQVRRNEPIALVQQSKKRIFDVLHHAGFVKTEEEKRKGILKKSIEKKVDRFAGIRQSFKKLPADSKNRVRLEVAVAREIQAINGCFSVADVMKKIDEIYAHQIERKDRIEIYDDLKSLVNSDLCQKSHVKDNNQYYKFV